MPCKKGLISNIFLKKDDKTSFDGKTNANIFKELFCNLASDLVAKLPPPSNEFEISSVRNYYQNILDLLPNKFNFLNVTKDFVPKSLKDMNIDKAAVIDNLSGKFLKDGANILAKPISKMCNLSIKYSVFPTGCQVAKLKPLYQKGSITLFRNYRPVSLLPLISKIIEKVIHDQTKVFRSAFRKKLFYRLVSFILKQ